MVAWFHNHTNGVEVKFNGSAVAGGNYMINEGPGHGGVGMAALLKQVNPMTGDAKRNRPLAKRLNPFSSPSFHDELRGNTGGKESLLPNLRGNFTGDGWDENVIPTINILQDLVFEKGYPIDCVNLVGWSRGAITCIRNVHFELLALYAQPLHRRPHPVEGRPS